MEGGGGSPSGHQVMRYEMSDLYIAVHGGYYGYQTPPPHPASHRRPTETRNCKMGSKYISSVHVLNLTVYKVQW